ncbi:patatin-like phospholipase domain-containing protein 4 isoform X2 [Marmota marmota marmota]|uniref:patatin-like phospholipase domain-containing protein 4 isoform X2 n=1 Tax=Marmota marmota marmota TaxID=9994 RepID=UPI00209378C7|nr:patatin-like phospholipase domain-containing protein 4 isoform X2 [Marmota marmota marmota]
MRVIKGRMKPINLSFAACGFLGIYHLGAASAFCRHGKRLLKDVKAFAGASAGSLVASVLLTAPEKIEECNRFTYQFAEETRKQSFGALTPGYDFMARLRYMFTQRISPPPQVLEDRVLNALQQSVPSAALALVKYLQSCSIINGSFGQQLCAHLLGTETSGIQRAGRTVTISPFCGRLDISPQDKGQLSVYIKVTNQDIMLSLPNLMRLNQALFPPSRRKMESLYRRGFDDTVQFLHKEDWFE